RQVEGLVFQERPPGQDVFEAGVLRRGKCRRWRQRRLAQMSAEIEVVAAPSAQAVPLEIVSEGRLAGARGADEEQCWLRHGWMGGIQWLALCVGESTGTLHEGTAICHNYRRSG